MKFIDNAGGGILIAGGQGDVANVRITQNLFEGPRPIRIKYAPRVHPAQICKNRYIAKEVPASEGFNAFADPADIVVVQDDCGKGRDMRFEMNRQKESPGDGSLRRRAWGYYGVDPGPRSGFLCRDPPLLARPPRRGFGSRLCGHQAAQAARGRRRDFIIRSNPRQINYLRGIVKARFQR